MHEYSEKQQLISTPKSSSPMTTGPAPVDSSQSIGVSLLSPEPEKAQEPKPRRRQGKPGRDCTLFMTQDQTGRRLGHNGTWLRRMAQKHPLLFGPCNGPSQKGVPALYTHEKIEFLYDYLTNTDLVTASEATKSWMERRQAKVSKAFSTGGQRRERRS